MKIEEDILPRAPSLAEIAKEEFWVVAKSFFAPIYGTMLVLKQLLKTTYYMDRNLPEDMSSGEKLPIPWVMPAE